VEWYMSTQDVFLDWVYYCRVNSCTPSGHHCSYITSSTPYIKVLMFSFQWC
jgi:hypothetical protein